MSIYSRLDRIAADVEKLNRQVKSVSNAPQSQRTSVEGGSIDFNDADGNLQAIFGGQDDGSTTVRHVDGPVPPIPSGLSAHVDGPIIQVTWDGAFEDAEGATFDWSHLEVVAVGPSNEQLRGTISDVTGASTSLAATVSGEWTVVARSVSRAGKRSLDGDAGTVEVEIVGLSGAIEAVQDSANGKNKVTYSSHAPTENDPGIFDDTWFVGQVGRPNDIVEATNLVSNPSFEVSPSDLALSSGLTSATQSSNAGGVIAGNHCLEVTGAASGIAANTAQIALYTSPGVSEGDYLGWGWSLATSEDLTVSVGVNWYNSGGSYISSEYQSYRAVPTSLERMSSAFLAPSGTYRARMIIRFRAANGTSPAPANFKVLTDGWSAVPAETEQPALDAVQAYFDGDTEDGTTDNESHYRWTGTPHASTSEKYLPALDIGESDNWNVIEQYRHDGTGWVKVELSHYVFSSVDLGKATVGELDGIRIMARSMSSEVFEGNAFSGYVFTGSIFRTTNGSEFSDNGLFMYDQDGTPRIQAPVDGSDFTINAEIVARSMTAVGRASFLSDNNRLEPGAGLVLASGVGDPPSPPVVSTFYPTIKPPVLEGDASVSGLAYGDGLFWRAVDAGKGLDHLDRIEGIDEDGVVQRTIPLDLFWARNGLTVIGDEVFALGRRDDLPESTRNASRWVRVFGLDGTYKRQWEYPHYYATSKYEPGIGCDESGNVVIAHCWSADGALTWRTFNKANGAQVAQFDSPDKAKSHINGFYIGTGDFGVKRVVVAKPTGGTGFKEFVVLNATTGVYMPDESWHTPGRVDPTGFAWDGEKFHSLNPDGSIAEYSTPSTGDDSAADWWAAYRWATVDDGSLDRHSRISPPARFAWPRRARLKVGAPNLPEGADSIAPSLAYKTTTPTRTDFHSPNWWYTEGEPTAYYYELPDFWYVGPSPDDSNNFPAADPATLGSASGLFEVKGDGSGRWGPLTFGTDGSVSGVPKVATGNVTVGTVPANGGKWSTVVTFPPGRFTTTPTVTAITENGRLTTSIEAGTVTAASVQINVFNWTGDPMASSPKLYWSAIEGG